MDYRKFQADHLFTGTEMLGKEYALIVSKNGTVEEIIKATDAGDGIQYFNGMLSPGFINCHCHLELSHMKNLLPEKTGLVDFVFNVVTQRHFPEEEILDAITKAEDEMFENGIVAVGDICNNVLTLAQKSKRRIHYYNFIEASGWLPNVAGQRFTRSKEYYDAFIAQFPSTSLSPHAPYSVSDELWNYLIPFFQNKTITIHNQETSFEDEFFINGTGDLTRMYQKMNMDISFFNPTNKSSLQSTLPKLSNAENVLLVHNTFMKEEDVKLVNGNGFFLCLCLNANQYIEEATPPVELFRKHGCKMVVGTDSLASNWSLNILDEIKTITKKFPSIPQTEILKWATQNGAEALQMQDQLGSFEKGKRPGIVFIEKITNEMIDKDAVSRRIL